MVSAFEVECQVPKCRLCDVLGVFILSYWNDLPSFRIAQHGERIPSFQIVRVDELIISGVWY